MKLGFIGTGKITSSVVTGICRSNLSFDKIILSSRSRTVAQKLKKKFRKISIARNNQDILNSCNWVFLAITPTVGHRIIKDLKFKSNQTIISFISTMTLPQLKKAIKVKAKIVRAIPLPPISLKKPPMEPEVALIKVVRKLDEIKRAYLCCQRHLRLVSACWAFTV